MRQVDDRSSESTVVRALRDGNQAACGRLFEQYFARLTRFVSHRMRQLPPLGQAEEDIAMSVFRSLIRAAGRQRLDRLTTRRDLWSLLVTLSSRKIADQIRRQQSLKRGGEGIGRGNRGAKNVEIPVDAVQSSEPSVESSLSVQEELQAMLQLLADADDQGTLRRIAELKLDGATHEQIAEELQCSLSRVERKLRRIRQVWGQRIEKLES